MDGGPGRIYAPEDNQFCFEQLTDIGGFIGAKVQLLGVQSGGKTRRASGLCGGPQTVEHALYGIMQQTKIAGILVEAQGQGRVIALL